ncbi:MAG: hypothetical protein M3Q37_11870 [Gemmatimonadota bacterium]|nr:hypothetical protein [Gemmatimonadota bacterium]
MTDHKIGTRAEWQGARDELAKLEAEHAERNAEIKRSGQPSVHRWRLVCAALCQGAS